MPQNRGWHFAFLAIMPRMQPFYSESFSRSNSITIKPVIAASRLIPILIVENMQAPLRFYAEVLGGTPIYRYPGGDDPSFITLRCGNSDMALSCTHTTLPENVAFRPATGHRIQLSVNVVDVDQSVLALRSIGSTVVMEPSNQAWGERAAYVEDPDGNLVLLVSPVKEART